jgi:hypothetical protein
MFIQVIQGKVGDAVSLRGAVERWRDEIAPNVPGWLGTTGGVTSDGTAIAVVRFESDDAARANSESAEQQRWWAEFSQYFDGPVTFHDCREIFTFLGGGSDDAGFVQVIQGHSTDMARMRQMFEQSSQALRLARPDVLGGVVALHGDGGFTQVVYFTSEADAREGEGKPPPPEMDSDLASMMSDATFLDLTRPWMHSPG